METSKLFVAFAFWRSGDVTFTNKGIRAVILVRTFLFVPLVVYWFSFAFGLIQTASSVFFWGICSLSVRLPLVEGKLRKRLVSCRSW